MKNHISKNVEEYIANAPKEVQSKLREIRAAIKSIVSRAEEGISYGFPLYKYQGTLAHFAVYKNHIALGFGSDLGDKDIEILGKNNYETGQKRLLIKSDQKVPFAIIKQIIKKQAKMNEAK